MALESDVSTLDTVITRVLELQPRWSKENTVEMQERGLLVRRQGPAAIRRLLASRLPAAPFDDIAVQGSDGTGLKTRIPWMRIHSASRSPSATEGWYLVFLFAFDGSAVYLSLNQGTTVPQGTQVKMRPPEILEARAAWARQVLGQSAHVLVSTIDLRDTGPLAAAYERGNVGAIRYGRDAIPDEETLGEDVTRLVGLLATLYTTPGEPSYGGSRRTEETTVASDRRPSLTDPAAFVRWARAKYGPSLVPTREAAEQQARELLDRTAGHMTSAEAKELGRLFNTGEWAGTMRFNRFSPAFAGASMERVIEPLAAFNEATQQLWRAPIEDALAFTDEVLRSPAVFSGAGRSYPTMLLHLRDPTQFVIWLQITHRGLTALGRLSQSNERKAGIKRYRAYCDAALDFAREFELAPQEIDAVLAEAARAAKDQEAVDRAEIAALIEEPPAELGESKSRRDVAIEEVAAGTYLPIERLEEWVAMLQGPKRQAIFHGPPGTGKTFVARQLAHHLAGADGHVEIVQFHPSYSYEDFVEGLRPVLSGAGEDDDDRRDARAVGYTVRDGSFKKFCSDAQTAAGTCVFVIDEMNRAELGAVLGEMMMLLEYRGLSVTLPYSQARFSVPENVVVLATMNTADRSLALVDFALRRRFHAIELLPDRDILEAHLVETGDDPLLALQFFDEVQRRIANSSFAPGHSYWMNGDATAEGLYRIWRYELHPYLAEYWYEHRHHLDALDAEVTKMLMEEA